MIEADTPNIWEIRRDTNHATAVGIIVIALTHAARLVNVEANLNETQIGEIANDIIEDFGYLKVEEIKYILKTAVRTKKIFGRLDYNVVMNWFEEYDAARTEHCIDISDQEETSEANRIAADPEAVSFEDYAARLRVRAGNGDGDALALLPELDRTAKPPLTAEERHKKDVGFFKWKQEYLKSKRK